MPIPLRSDFDASQLRGLARQTKDAPQARRLLALAAIYEGASRTHARGSAASRCRSCATGCSSSTLTDLKV